MLHRRRIRGEGPPSPPPGRPFTIQPRTPPPLSSWLDGKVMSRGEHSSRYPLSCEGEQLSSGKAGPARYCICRVVSCRVVSCRVVRTQYRRTSSRGGAPSFCPRWGLAGPRWPVTLCVRVCGLAGAPPRVACLPTSRPRGNGHKKKDTQATDTTLPHGCEAGERRHT